MRMKLACVVGGVGVLLAVAPVWAHHAFSAEFDIEKPLTMTGTLVRWDMINPHSWFHLDIEDADGTVVTWMVEGGSPNELIRNGVTKNTLTIGSSRWRAIKPRTGRPRRSAGTSRSQTASGCFSVGPPVASAPLR